MKKSLSTLLKDQLEANGFSLMEFSRGYKIKNSSSWKRGYAAAFGILYGSYIESQILMVS